MSEERRLIVPAELEEVPRACAFVVEAAEAAGLDDRAVYHCQMAVDEWCTNIVEHGFQGSGAHGRIEIDCLAEPAQLRIVISDDSPKFDPTALVEPKTDQPVDEREPGGLGWFLIKRIMDDVQYDYVNGRNRLRMLKRSAANSSTVRASPMTFPSHEVSGHIWVITPSGRLELEYQSAARSDAHHAVKRQPQRFDRGYGRCLVHFEQRPQSADERVQKSARQRWKNRVGGAACRES